MIPNETKQEIATSGEGVKLIGNLHFDEANQARILITLGDKIYTRKELAVVREYSNNMADAQKEAGKLVSDCIVSLPTYDDLTVKFRDFGAGLSKDEIVNIYCNLGTSTKRNSDDYNGVLGYGSKAFQCISDSVTVTSWNNGEKAIYQIIKGDTQTLPQIYELARCSSDEPTGIEVCVPIQSDIMYSIHSEAADFFKYWDVLPQIVNLNEEYKVKMDKFRNIPPILKGEGWEIRSKVDYTPIGVAYMGGVAYPLDWNKISSNLPIDTKTRALLDLLRCNDIVLKYKMGEVRFVDSREGLEYNTFTLAAINSRILDIVAKIREAVQEKFTNASNIWEAKKIYNSIFGSGLPIEIEDGNIEVDSIKILAGNVSKLEESLRGQLVWNNIPITDASFRLINRFDNNLDNIEEKSYTPYFPVMTTYRPKKNRIKTFKCKSDVYNGITASDKVGVVINDINKKSGLAMVMRYLLFSNKYQYKLIHMLNFESASIKSEFYKEYNFYSVPTLNLSELMDDAKEWYSANKTTRSGGSGTSVVRKMEYIDLVSEKIEESNLSFKDIEDESYFLYKAPGIRGRGRKRGDKVKFNNVELYVRDVLNYIKTVNEKLNLDIDQVYIIDGITANAKWFENSIGDKTWLPFDKFITDEVSSNVNPQELVDQYTDNEIVGTETAKTLSAEFGDNHILTKLFNDSISIVKDKDTIEFIDAIQQLYIWRNLVNGISPSVNIHDIKNKIASIYPYINWARMKEGSLNNEIARKTFVKYIKSIDLYIVCMLR